MNTHVKPIASLGLGILLSLALTQKIHAQGTLVMNGISPLADSLGTSTGSEALSVQWSVYYNNTGNFFTYFYQLNNPAGDILLNPDGSPYSPTVPESVDTFTVDFNAAPPGMVISGNQTYNNGPAGLEWVFSSGIAPGANSGLLSFESNLGPGPTPTGSAQANNVLGGSPPAPWATSTSLVSVPRAVPEPATLALMGAGASAFLMRRNRRS